jgi:phenylalanine-4-hydroxylase
MKRLMLDELPAEVPQPCDVSRVLETATGFRLARASGMTDTPTFLRFLAKRIFAATTFLRAPHELQFTSQPDWIHEFYGHAVSLVDDRMARLYEHFGRAASSASTRTAMTHLEQLYWYSIETSVIRDQASSRAIGAALLSSVSELHGMASYVKLPFDPVAMAATPYRSDVPQQTVFEARSFDEYLDSLHDYLHFLER